MNIKTIAMLTTLGGLFGCASVQSTDDIPVVKNFDAARYAGTWCEIARLPKWYERGQKNVTAKYELDGSTLRVTNLGWCDGEVKTSTAVGHFAGWADEGAFRNRSGLVPDLTHSFVLMI